MTDNTSYGVGVDVNADLKNLQMRRLKAFTHYYAEDKKLRGQLEACLAEIDAEVALLLDKNHELPCLVRRTPGPDHSVYHSADAPCGRVRDRSNFKEVDEWEAMNEGDYSYLLNRCTACDWSRAARVASRHEQQ
ncbi:hypothetical protein ACFVW5_04740 [Streptomyces sp. NPDC058232]|uniref:hypothetical protein n=1 Tax=Streptomyces sp. NPDC058232 TaxID=3346393 RepID=UPI0036E78859